MSEAMVETVRIWTEAVAARRPQNMVYRNAADVSTTCGSIFFETPPCVGEARRAGASPSPREPGCIEGAQEGVVEDFPDEQGEARFRRLGAVYADMQDMSEQEVLAVAACIAAIKSVRTPAPRPPIPLRRPS